jgi:cysteinyl-tRNA synthetase
MSELFITNSLTHKKELFKPLHPPFVGLYVCGPTVYGDPHLGHARPYITFDVLFRYLKYLNYKVRYVRNITDVGHLENDADEGESKVDKKARLEKLEPMEVVQHYTIQFRRAMDLLNNLPPSIEPSASGHIIEQIKMIEEILAKGFAYEVNGSIYFDVIKYSSGHDYGKLSGRKIEDLISGNRELDAQDEKHNAVDFALWKKAQPYHIMHWPSPWSEGFPGWHIECSAMSEKYLGENFDIHGGGMDLLFPHHEAEIAQSTISNEAHGNKHQPVNYWMHPNMITIGGKKMGKSLNNAISLEQFFSGDHPLLEKAYSPMTIRFFILQTHYRSTLDFSNEALQAAEKGLQRLMGALEIAKNFQYEKNSEQASVEEELATNKLCDQVFDDLNDDLNTAKVIAVLFELASKFYALKNKQLSIHQFSMEVFNKMKTNFIEVTENILGLKPEIQSENNKLDDVIKILIDIRKESKAKKDFATSDKIRNELSNVGVQLKDNKDGTIDYSI